MREWIVGGAIFAGVIFIVFLIFRKKIKRSLKARRLRKFYKGIGE